jgi:hypothetical protein
MYANPNNDHQLIVNTAGELEPDPKGPRSWDGEPLYSPETVQELFNADAFRQYKGQTAMES